VNPNLDHFSVHQLGVRLEELIAAMKERVAPDVAKQIIDHAKQTAATRNRAQSHWDRLGDSSSACHRPIHGRVT
jgi:hypothetical protein